MYLDVVDKSFESLTVEGGGKVVERHTGRRAGHTKGTWDESILQDMCKAVDRVEGRLKEGAFLDACQESFGVEPISETCRGIGSGAGRVQEAMDKLFRKPIGYGFELIDEPINVCVIEKEVETFYTYLAISIGQGCEFEHLNPNYGKGILIIEWLLECIIKELLLW